MILAAWDGRYDAGSAGVVVLDATMVDPARRMPGQARLRPYRMPVRHHFGLAPGIGWRYRFDSDGSAGGNDILNKSGQKPVRGRHDVTCGASARFLADLSGPDTSRVVLLGGQDGWLGSDDFADQDALWRRGRSVQLPLGVEAARQFPHHAVVRPD